MATPPKPTKTPPPVPVSEDDLSDVLTGRGFEAIDLEALFAAGKDLHPYEHAGCGGTITKLMPGFIYCDHARCEQCGKEGRIGPLLDIDDEGDAVDVFREVLIEGEDVVDHLVPLAVFLDDEPEFVS